MKLSSFEVVGSFFVDSGDLLVCRMPRPPGFAGLSAGRTVGQSVQVVVTASQKSDACQFNSSIFCKQVFLMALILLSRVSMTCECKATDSGMRSIARWETRNEGTHYIESRAASPIGLRASEEVVDTSGPLEQREEVVDTPGPPGLREDNLDASEPT